MDPRYWLCEGYAQYLAVHGLKRAILSLFIIIIYANRLLSQVRFSILCKQRPRDSLQLNTATMTESFKAFSEVSQT